MNDKTLCNLSCKEYYLCLCCEKVFEEPHGKPRDFDAGRYCVGKTCPDCGEVRGNGVVNTYNDPENGEFRATYIGCLECNPMMKKFRKVCEDCFYKEKRKRITVKNNIDDILTDSVKEEENDNLSKSIKENRELKKQLVKIQQELTKAFEKSIQQNNSRLEQEIIQIQEKNQELITNKNIHVDKIKEQFRKSQNLLKKASASVENTNFSPQNKISIYKDNKIFSSFPYVIGGSVIFSSILTFGYYLLRKNKEK